MDKKRTDDNQNRINDIGNRDEAGQNGSVWDSGSFYYRYRRAGDSLNAWSIISYLLNLAFIAMAVALMGWLFYLYAIDQNPPAVIYNRPLPTDKMEYKTGDSLLVYTEFCNYTTKEYVRYMEFRDGLVYPVAPLRRVGGPLGCQKQWVNLLTIPKNLPEGEYYLSGSNVIKVNFLVSRTVRWQTERFRVFQ